MCYTLGQGKMTRAEDLGILHWDFITLQLHTMSVIETVEDPMIPDNLDIWAKVVLGRATDGATLMQRQFYYMLHTFGMTGAQCLKVYQEGVKSMDDFMLFNSDDTKKLMGMICPKLNLMTKVKVKAFQSWYIEWT